MSPGKFIRDNALSVWFSVPSVPMFMEKMRSLRPRSLPSLRWSFFCGEALPIRAVKNWTTAAPNSRIVNLYGPTETTIAITEYEWEPSPGDARLDTVPLGWVFPSHRACLLADGQVNSGPGRGELCLSGPQVTTGYLNDATKTAEHYVRFADRSDIVWYKTGDIVDRRDDGCMLFVGRADSQVKINGHRVELQEIEAILRALAKSDLIVAVPWPSTTTGAGGVVACAANVSAADCQRILRACQDLLPPYMVPSRLVSLPALPLNANGKIDRKAIVALLDNPAVCPS
jgi:acyl-coenzyme A synthetase/AMP-(fatty) acid ligase